MEFYLMEEKHVEEAVQLSTLAYKDECQAMDSLPTIDFSETIKQNLISMIDNNLGIIAIENGKIIGFLAGYGPINEFFGKSNGIFIPIDGHGTIKENRNYIYTSLYREAAKYWASKEIFTHGIGVYSHDLSTLNNFFVNGFGMRCVDAITSLYQNPLTFEALKNVQLKGIKDLAFSEALFDEIENIHRLRLKLEKHLNESPVFFYGGHMDLKTYTEDRIKRKSRFFVCKKQDELIAYIEITSDGENFVSLHKSVVNICGAYINEQYRGKGIMTKLLAYTFDKIRDMTIDTCGVDCESINPQAYGFWTKHFTPYKNSLVRRIDERSKVKEYELKKQS